MPPQHGCQPILPMAMTLTQKWSYWFLGVCTGFFFFFSSFANFYSVHRSSLLRGIFTSEVWTISLGGLTHTLVQGLSEQLALSPKLGGSGNRQASTWQTLPYYLFFGWGAAVLGAEPTALGMQASALPLSDITRLAWRFHTITSSSHHPRRVTSYGHGSGNHTPFLNPATLPPGHC